MQPSGCARMENDCASSQSLGLCCGDITRSLLLCVFDGQQLYASLHECSQGIQPHSQNWLCNQGENESQPGLRDRRASILHGTLVGTNLIRKKLHDSQLLLNCR